MIALFFVNAVRVVIVGIWERLLLIIGVALVAMVVKSGWKMYRVSRDGMPGAMPLPLLGTAYEFIIGGKQKKKEKKKERERIIIITTITIIRFEHY